MAKISAEINGHGTFSASGTMVDMVTKDYQLYSDEELRAEVSGRAGIDYSDISARITLLIILADWQSAE